MCFSSLNIHCMLSLFFAVDKFNYATISLIFYVGITNPEKIQIWNKQNAVQAVNSVVFKHI